jgi:hypothetical protein
MARVALWSGDREQEEENFGTKPWNTEIREPWRPGSGKYWEEPENLHSVIKGSPEDQERKHWSLGKGKTLKLCEKKQWSLWK